MRSSDMPRSGSPRQIPPAVGEPADRLSARRSLAGAAGYPFVLLAIGWTADLHRKSPLLFAAAAVAVLVLAGLRAGLTLRFEALYPAGPQRWRIGFYSTLVGKALILGWLFFAAIE